MESTVDSMSPAVPQEVVDKILDFIPDTPDGLKALKSASLTCLSFRPRACARLFRRIDLRDSDSEPTKLDSILRRAPHLLHYVRVLRFIGDRGGGLLPSVGLFRTTTLPTSLKALWSEGNHRVTLRRIELRNLDWEYTLSSDMRAVLLDLLVCTSLCQVRLHKVHCCSLDNMINRLSPSVKTLDISCMNIPLSKIFRYLLQLETLTIRFPTSITHEVLQTPAEWVIRLRTLELFTRIDLWPVYRAVIQHASSSLEELYIVTPSDILANAEHFNSVDLSQFPRIRKIVIITPRFHNWLLGPYLASFSAVIVWLSQSLSNMSHDNNIEQVTVRFCVEIAYRFRGHLSWFGTAIEQAVWQSLDETLSQPNLASSKTFRGINLEVCTDTQDVYDCVNELVHANLPRMERSKKLHVTRERFNDVRYNIEP